MKLEVYTDGSATTKEKPGGYGWVIVIDGTFHSEGSGSLPNATNNDAEMEAAIVGLANLYQLNKHGVPFVDGDVFLVSDSQIVLGWLSGRFRFKQTIKNNKFETLMRLKKMMNVRGRWVEGHTGDEWNERCDKLAGIERKRAMGIEPSKRINRVKMLKEACDKMQSALEYIKSEVIILEQNHDFPRHDIEDRAIEALEHYAQIKEQIK